MLGTCQARSALVSLSPGLAFSCTVSKSQQLQVKTGQIKSSSLENYSCISLAGLCSEYLKFGKAEGGLADISQLDAMYKGLGFSQSKADSEVRWAVLNTISMLRRHTQAHERLAEAMSGGASVGQCIALLEDELANSNDI